MSNINWSEEVLNEMLSTPSQALIADVAKMDGDIMILGAAAKWVPICVCWLRGQ